MVITPADECVCSCFHIKELLGGKCDKCNCVLCKYCNGRIKRVFMEIHKRRCNVHGSPRY